ncbi:MAG: nitroreductase family protein [Thermoanaerobaculia bacterium]
MESPRCAQKQAGRQGGSVVSRLARLPALQYLALGLDASYDFVRYLRFFTPAHSRPTERSRLEALLFLNYHVIEKSLALPEPPELFGTNSLEAVLDLLDRWTELIGDRDAVVYQGACGALRAYRERVGKRLAMESPALSGRLDRLLAAAPDAKPGAAEGGTRAMTAAAFRSAVEKIDFPTLAAMRHSVRNFADQPVPDDAIAGAVRVAQQSPSACNRQAWRVHVYTSPADKAEVLRVQNGNAGFGHLAARILVLTADTRSFVTSSERHQAFIDGGMFAMSLVYALEARGIVSCCLNLSTYCFQDATVHRVCRIPASEALIMMLAIGYPPEQFRVARSARLPTESVISWRTL